MAIIDLRPQVTPNEPADEEVKDVAEDGQADESSTAEEPSNEAEAVADDTASTTEADAETADTQTDKDDEAKRAVEALQLERERLRKDIEDLRAARRKEREVKPQPDVLVDKNALDGVAPQDVELIEKVLRAKGYVRKDEVTTLTYQEKLSSHQDEWLATHPEYLPANDADDKNWTALRQYVDTYFKAPADPRDIKKILDIAHAQVKPQQPLPVRARATTAAAKEKIATASKGGAGGAPNKPSPTSQSRNLDPRYLVGFTEDEVKEILQT